VSVNRTGRAEVLRRQWRVVCLAVLLAVGVALLVTQVAGKRYTSSVGLLVSGSSPGSVDESASRSTAADRARLFAQIATTDSVVTAAVQAAGGPQRTQVRAAHVSVRVTTPGNGQFLTVQVTADDPDSAQAVAKAYPLVLPGQLARLNQLPVIAPTDSLLAIVTPAARPTHPSRPRPLLNIGIGLAAGLLLGILAAGLREALSPGSEDADRRVGRRHRRAAHARRV
jgi:uncharacterized protein involved in exopolysaccharide biosynthesis